MFKSRQLPLPKPTWKPDNNKNFLGDHDNIFTKDKPQEKEQDPFAYMLSINGPKPRIHIPMQYLDSDA